MQNKIIFQNQFLLALAALFLSFGMANAQANEYQNTTADGQWNTAGNWTLGVVPAASHQVSIKNGSTATISAGVNAFADGILLGASGGTIVVEAGATLSLQGSGSHAIRLQPGDITNNGTITIDGNYAEGIELQNLGTHPGNLVTNNGTITINGTTNEAFLLGQNNYHNTVENNGEILLGPDIGKGILGFLTTAFNNNDGASLSILGATTDGIAGSLDFTNEAGATLCIENVGGDPIQGTINLVNNGTYNTSGCTPPTIPTMSEWALIIFGLIVLSFGVVYVMRWSKTQQYAKAF